MSIACVPRKGPGKPAEESLFRKNYENLFFIFPKKFLSKNFPLFIEISENGRLFNFFEWFLKDNYNFITIHAVIL